MTTQEDRIRLLEGVLRDMAIEVAKGTAGKLHAIRAYRAATGHTPKDSKDFVESFAVARQPVTEDSRIQRVEDKVALLERRVNSLEGYGIAHVGQAMPGGEK